MVFSSEGREITGKGGKSLLVQVIYLLIIYLFFMFCLFNKWANAHLPTYRREEFLFYSVYREKY